MVVSCRPPSGSRCASAAALHEARGRGWSAFPRGGLREAVERRYLADPATKSAAHRRLADYFGGRPILRRVVEERPWHLAAVGDWGALARLLADPGFLEAAWPVHRYELRVLEGGRDGDPCPNGRRPGPAGRGARPSGPGRRAAPRRIGPARRALRIVRTQAARHRSGDGVVEVAVLDLAAGLALESGDLEAAHAFSLRQAAEAESSGDADARVAALARLAAVERRRGAVEPRAGRSGGRGQGPGERPGLRGPPRRG